jgi:ribose/xylose/arabinose/galactoside ABC-type transport system permease subunit
MSQELEAIPRTGGRTARGTTSMAPGYWLLKVFATVGPLPFLLLLLVVGVGLVNPVFLGSSNLSSVTTQSVYLLLISLAQMLILVTGGFDLSVGANVALTSVTSSLVMRSVYGGVDGYSGAALLWGLVVALLVGLVVGLVNGIGVAVLKVNAFIVTLATMSVFTGATMLVSGGSEVSGLPRVFTHGVGSGRLWGVVPVPLLMILPIVVALVVVLRRMRYGKSLFAIGSNELAAKVAGTRVGFNLLMAYVLSGVITSYAGWLLTARVSSGQPQLGGELAMQSITAAIIGGASLLGGRGGVGGTVLGVLFIVGLTNGMNLMRMDSNQQKVALGLALVLSVLVSRARDRARRRVAVLELDSATADRSGPSETDGQQQARSLAPSV